MAGGEDHRWKPVRDLVQQANQFRLINRGRVGKRAASRSSYTIDRVGKVQRVADDDCYGKGNPTDDEGQQHQEEHAGHAPTFSQLAHLGSSAGVAHRFLQLEKDVTRSKLFSLEGLVRLE